MRTEARIARTGLRVSDGRPPLRPQAGIFTRGQRSETARSESYPRGRGLDPRSVRTNTTLGRVKPGWSKPTGVTMNRGLAMNRGLNLNRGMMMNRPVMGRMTMGSGFRGMGGMGRRFF